MDLLNMTIDNKIRSSGAFETFFGRSTRKQHSFLQPRSSGQGLLENMQNPLLKKTKNLVTPYNDDPLVEKGSPKETSYSTPTEKLKETKPTDPPEKTVDSENKIKMSGTVTPISRRFTSTTSTQSGIVEPKPVNINLEGSLATVEDDPKPDENIHNITNFGQPFGSRNKVRSLLLTDSDGNVKKYYKSKLAFQKDTGKRITKTFGKIGEQVNVNIDGEKHIVIAITLQDYNENFTN